MKTTEWKKLTPTSPYYFLVPRKEEGKETYRKYWEITDILPAHVTGIITARDKFVVAFDKSSLKKRIRIFKDLSVPDEIVKETFKLKDTRGWKLSKARKELAKDEKWDQYFTEIFYRPFDMRYIYYSRKMVDWPRPEVMRHICKKTLAS